MPTITLPLLLTIFGFRSSGRATIIGMIAGISAVIVLNRFFAHLGLDAIVPGMIANLLFLMGSHYILQEKGGWVGIKKRATASC